MGETDCKIVLLSLCKEKLGWSKTTTYTVIKRLAERGVIKNEKATVTSLITKEQAQISEMNELMERRFEGSVPDFIAAFAKHQKLSDQDIKEIKKIINSGVK